MVAMAAVIEIEIEQKWKRVAEGWWTQTGEVNDGGAVNARVLVSCSLRQ